jgi:hypothetical protein
MANSFLGNYDPNQFSTTNLNPNGTNLSYTGYGSTYDPNLLNFNTQNTMASLPNLQANASAMYGDTSGLNSSINSAVTGGVYPNTPTSNNFNFASAMPYLQFGTQALQGVAGLYGAYNQSKATNQQLSLARDQYNTNLTNYRKTTNADMSDRQARRVAANPNAESVDSYMKKWGV